MEVKLDMIQDQQRFKQSSFGVQFYSCELAGVRLKWGRGACPLYKCSPPLEFANRGFCVCILPSTLDQFEGLVNTFSR